MRLTEIQPQKLKENFITFNLILFEGCLQNLNILDLDLYFKTIIIIFYNQIKEMKYINKNCKHSQSQEKQEFFDKG